MAAPVKVEATAEKLAQLARLREQKAALEARRMSELDVFALIGYKPHEKQREFHAAKEFDVLYGGAAGGGKVTRSWPKGYEPAPGTLACAFS